MKETLNHVVAVETDGQITHDWTPLLRKRSAALISALMSSDTHLCCGQMVPCTYAEGHLGSLGSSCNQLLAALN